MTYETLTTHKDLARWVNTLTASKRFAIDTETTGVDALTCDLVGVSLSVVSGGDVRSCYIPVGHTKKAMCGAPQLSVNDVCESIAPLCGNPKINKVLQNAVYDLLVLERYGVEFANVDDTMLMSYALRPGPRGHGMDDLAMNRLGHDTIRFDDVVITDPLVGMENFADVRIDHATNYAAEDTEVTLLLFHDLRKALKDAGQWGVYRNIDRNLVYVIADMKRNGVPLAKKKSLKLAEKWQAEMDEAVAKVHEYKPGINIGSSQQLQAFLFDELGLPVLKETDSGLPSTDADTLAAHEGAHPAVAPIMKYKLYQKLVSTYVGPNGMPSMVRPDTGRIHGDLNICLTNTARFSSSKPNLQNPPSPNKEGIRGEIGKTFRGLFRAPKGRLICAADYSQIELRVLAHETNDAALVEAYVKGLDIHSRTATQVFETDEEEAGKDKWGALRRAAKTINFGLIYGMSKWGLAHSLKIDVDTAQEFIDRYFRAMPGVADWAERQKEIGRRDRVVHTCFGRALYLEKRRDRQGTAYAERQAMNYPIQGGAADFIRLACVAVARELDERDDLDAALLLQVHDELLLEVDERDAEKTRTIVKSAMERAGDGHIKWRVPIIADAKVGDSWLTAH